MDHKTSFSSGPRSGTTLRYRLVPGSTVRYEVRLNLYMEIRQAEEDARPAIVDAQIYGTIDYEVMKKEGALALVRQHPHRTDLWVKSGSTVDEDQVSDPLSGLPPAFLLDDLGSTVPVVDLEGSAVAAPDDGNAARFALKALFPPFVEDPVQDGDCWETELARGTTSARQPVVVEVEFGRMRQASDGRMGPVLLHKCSYEWTVGSAEREGGIEHSGRTRHASETHTSAQDGWAMKSEGKIQVESTVKSHDGRTQLVSTMVELTATRV